MRKKIVIQEEDVPGIDKYVFKPTIESEDPDGAFVEISVEGVLGKTSFSIGREHFQKIGRLFTNMDGLAKRFKMEQGQ